MKGVRIEPESRHTVSVSITCACGRSTTKNEETGKNSFAHSFATIPSFTPSILACACGKRFQVRFQRTHFHVDEL